MQKTLVARRALWVAAALALALVIIGMYTPGGDGGVSAGPVIPPNDDFANAITITTLPYSQAQDSSSASVETGEPFSCGSLTRSVWYSFTPSADVVLEPSAREKTVELLAVYTGADLSSLDEHLCNVALAGGGPRPRFEADTNVTYYFQVGGFFGSGELEFSLEAVLPPANDNFVNAVTVTALPYSDEANNEGATSEGLEPQPCDLPTAATVWYSYTPSADTILVADATGTTIRHEFLAVYTGSSLEVLELLRCHASFGSQAVRVTVKASAGQTYYFQAGGIDLGEDCCGDFFLGTFAFNLTEASPPPENDHFPDSSTIPAPLPYSNKVDTTGATEGVDEPQPPFCGGNDVWYSYTPVSDGVLVADASGGDFSAWIGLYVGNSAETLTNVHCVFRRLPFFASAGETYHFQVGRLKEFGNVVFSLKIEDPPLKGNDAFADALAITPEALPFSNAQSNRGATVEATEPTGCVINTVWYSFTPTQDSLMRADIAGSDHETRLRIYTAGEGLSALNQISSCTSESTFVAHAGVTYFIQVGTSRFAAASGGLAGEIQFNLDGGPLPAVSLHADAQTCLFLGGALQCDVGVGQSFVLSVSADAVPVHGYVAFQSLIFWGTYDPLGAEDGAEPGSCGDGLDGNDPERDGGGDGADHHDPDCVTVSLTYKPDPPAEGTDTNEVTWPDSALSLRSSPLGVREYLPGASEDDAGPGTCSDGLDNANEQPPRADRGDGDCYDLFLISWAAVHGGITGILPPLSVSHHVGNVVEVTLTCSPQPSTTEILLLQEGDPLADGTATQFGLPSGSNLVPTVTNLTINCVDIAPAAVGGVALNAELRGLAGQDGRGGAPWLWPMLGLGVVAALSALAITRRRHAASR